jgi:dihydropteroate synthase
MQRPFIIGVLNVTPDSFYDGGRYHLIDTALTQVERMLLNGADIVEIGGESTGPSSQDVPEEYELQRTIPVIKEIVKRWPKTKISIDTYKSAVARAAIAEGAVMVNDVTAGRGDPDMFPMLAMESVSIVLMYSKDATPRTTIDPRQYTDVTHHICTFLMQRAVRAQEQGIARERIILDPGLGHFVSADPVYSFSILHDLQKFAALGYPILVSPSRKSFLAGPEQLPPSERLPGTIAACAIATVNGASYIRTHDVLAVRRACEVAALMRTSATR